MGMSQIYAARPSHRQRPFAFDTTIVCRADPQAQHVVIGARTYLGLLMCMNRTMTASPTLYFVLSAVPNPRDSRELEAGFERAKE